MIIYFVRHAHPDYKKDCLTELGRLQAEAASGVLCKLGIKRIFSSTNGRAHETAEYTAKKLGLEITPCDFMREIPWGPLEGKEVPVKGHPWHMAAYQAAMGETLIDFDWRDKYPFGDTLSAEATKVVANGIDGLLCELGYEREGEYYRVTKEDTDTVVAIFAHGGSSSAAFSHMFNIPFPQICGLMHISFTGITKVCFDNEHGTLVYPKFHGLNEDRHIDGLRVDETFKN